MSEPCNNTEDINEVLEYNEYDLESWIESNGKPMKATSPLYPIIKEDKANDE